MKRFTAMRAAKIASAVVCPPILLTWYLSLVYDWRNDYLLVLFLVFVLTSHSPALCADPIAEDEASKTRHGKEGYIIAASIGLSSGIISPYYLLVFFLLFALISYSPSLCADPIAEDAAARTRRDKRRSIIAVGIGLSTAFIVWLSGHTQVMAFFSSLKPRLQDWKPTTVMMLLCLQMLRLSLRKALAFKVTDLYPHLRRAEKSKA